MRTSKPSSELTVSPREDSLCTSPEGMYCEALVACSGWNRLLHECGARHARVRFFCRGGSCVASQQGGCLWARSLQRATAAFVGDSVSQVKRILKNAVRHVPLVYKRVGPCTVSGFSDMALCPRGFAVVAYLIADGSPTYKMREGDHCSARCAKQRSRK
jgi:hypothetical protein